MEKKSWVCTIVIQLSLCVAVYCAINIGRAQTLTYRLGIQSPPNEIYFISVRGGFRLLKEQARLLKQIEKVVNAYKVGFVINVSELGEDDPLLKNATQYFNSLKAPWYTTKVLRGKESGYFVKQFNISEGKMVDIIALNTGSIQDFSSGNGNAQLQWLTKTLESSKSNWHIAVGLHPLFCNQTLEPAKEKENNFLYHMFLKHGVDAYLSGLSCADKASVRRPYFTILSEKSYPHREMANSFLLHRVSPLELATYGVSLRGDMVQESTIKQRGRDVI